MEIFNYNKFLINEAVVALSNDVISKLKKVSDLLTDKDREWVDKIIDKSGENIESNKLDDRNAYFFDLTDDPKYFDMDITKPLSSSIQSFKVGRALKIMAPDIPTDILSNITSALQSQLDYEIKLVEGDEIILYYTYGNNIDPEGTLGKSCMNNMDEEFFYLYSENKGVVKLAVLLDDDDYLIARALLWKTNIGWVMDRVYYSSDKYEYLFKDWAKDNNYITKREMEINEPKDGIKIELEKSKFDHYPYLDTFNYICFNKKKLSNSDVFYGDDEVAMLNSVDGDFEPFRNVEMSFHNPFTNLTDYKWVRELTTFIEYSIDYKRWLSDFIDEEFESFYTNPEKFLDVYEYFIKHNFNELNLEEIDKDIDIENYKEMILDFQENYTSKYEDILRKVIEMRYSKEEGYVSWADWHYEIYGGDIGSYQNLSRREKEFYDKFIRRYCDLDILEENLRKIHSENYENYERIAYKITPY